MSDERLVDGGAGSGRGADVPGNWGARPGSNNGGGPKTVRGLERVERNLRPQGGSNFRHGVYRFIESEGAMAPPCGRCIYAERCEEYEAGATCTVAERYQAELIEELMGLEHVLEQDALAVRELATIATGLRILDQYIAAHGPFVPGASPVVIETQPVLAKLRSQLSAKLLGLLNDFGLTPRARATLKIEQQGGSLAGLAAMLLAIEDERVRAAGSSSVLRAEALQEQAGQMALLEGEFEEGEGRGE